VHLAAVAHMRAEVLAPGVGHTNLAILAAPDREVLREVAQRLDLADRDEIGLLDRVPAKRKADVESALGRAGAIVQRGDAPVDQVLPAQLFQDLPDGDWGGAGVGCACCSAHGCSLLHAALDLAPGRLSMVVWTPLTRRWMSAALSRGL
jgi:hypothetical protein